MNELPYKIIKQIHNGARYIVYTAKLENENTPFVLKRPKSNYPTAQSLSKLRGEFEILKKMNYSGIVRVQGLETVDNSLVLILNKIDGVNLSDKIALKTYSLDEFFITALQLARTLIFLHERRVVHKNINPNNIIIDVKNDRSILLGFGLASEQLRGGERPNSKDSNFAELPYISPEQTGRINKTLDYRSDLYSLGAVFYEMLTGQTPFVTNDSMEMIHSHIAKQPVPPYEININIPLVISKIVMRLLSSNPEDRYQSSTGLVYDLNACLEQISDLSDMDNFEIGSKDISDQFHVPDKIYGREKELNTMLRSYKKVKEGNVQVMFIAGYSGVGKSSLVSEFKRAISQENGYFIEGKFDQYKRDVPLSSLMNTFSDLTRQLLSESDERIAYWKKEIQLAVGPNGKIITNTIPEMELLIGKQAEVPKLGHLEENNRFNRVFNNIIKVFSKKNHPLCIFLDDLQWIDSATREWIETQVTGSNLKHLLFIGAYRDNEVTKAHPVNLFMRRLKESNIAVNSIHLQPFKEQTLNALVADTLVTNPENIEELTKLIYQKTNGNPFFTKQCLLSLNEDNAIFFDSEKQKWDFSLEKARKAEISDNVVELMVNQIQKLNPEVRSFLKIAACIGNQFNEKLLSEVTGQNIENSIDQISNAVKKGLLLPVFSWNSDAIDYKFLHDRVQQAAFSLSNEIEKQEIRLKTGRILLKGTKVSEASDKIYEIADHLNFAQSLISEPEEINLLVKINLAAAIRAKNSMAYQSGLNYIKKVMDDLPSDNWMDKDILTRDLFLERAECEHLSGNNGEAEVFYDMAIDSVQNPLDKAEVFQRKIHYYCNLRKFNEAYQTGREAILPLGVKLPMNFSPPQLVKEVLLYRILLKGRKVSDIINITEMSNEKLKKAILLMASFARAAYQIKPQLCIALSARMVNICLKHGNTDGVYIGYLAFGPIFFGAILNKKQSGFDLGQLTLALVEKYKNKLYKAETHFVVGYFAIPWRQPATEMEKYWQIAYESGLEVGDNFHASCACISTIQSLYMRGVAFDEIITLSNQYLEFLNRIENNEAVLTIQSVQQSIRNLQGKTNSSISFSNSMYDETESLKYYHQFSSRHFAHYYFINKMQNLYLWGHYEKAYEISLESDLYLKDSPGMLHTAEHYFYKCLIICGLYESSTGIQKFKWKKSLFKLLNIFKGYTKGCSVNFIHKYQLLQAETSRVFGKNTKAEKYYYLAIDSATKHNYLNVLALANSLITQYYYKVEKFRLAGFHLRETELGYTKLGATSLSDDLINRCPSLLEYGQFVGSSEEKEAMNIGFLKSNKKENLDLTTVLKSSVAISQEIRLKDLVRTLLKIIVENAGAERMVLLINLENKLYVKAEHNSNTDSVKILEDTSIDQYADIPRSVINYVARSQEHVIVDDAILEGNFSNDDYFIQHQTRSVICVPLVRQGNLTGIIYLENNLATNVFTEERVNMILFLSGQMAISLENSLLYESLESKVLKRTKELKEEKDKSDILLLNILPEETAKELKEKGKIEAHLIDYVTVLFTDFNRFTELSESIGPQELVGDLNEYFSAFDHIMKKHGVEKIKTIGDSYMAAGGVPVPCATHAEDVIKASLDIQKFMINLEKKRKRQKKHFFEIRMGVHTGPVVAGIVGIKKFQYDIWGDTVNTASRMESSCEVGKINISESTYELVKDKYDCKYRGKINAKSKGKINMYFVEGPLNNFSTEN